MGLNLMRLVIDSLIGLMLAWILGAVLIHYQDEQSTIYKYQQVHQTLASLQEQSLYHGALGEVETTPGHFPLDMSLAWFNDHPPVNVMTPGPRPWLDIAPADDKSDHPPDPVVVSLEQAGFWYNPNRGIFRARVLPQFTDEETLALYNQLNGTSMRWLPRKEVEADVKPHPASSIVATSKTAAANKAHDPNRTTLVDDPRP